VQAATSSIAISIVCNKLSPSGGTRPRAKPPVRKLAADLHVDLASLTPGSGQDGIVTREDVLAAAGTS